jgi:hypothetical protein
MIDSISTNKSYLYSRASRIASQIDFDTPNASTDPLIRSKLFKGESELMH